MERVRVDLGCGNVCTYVAVAAVFLLFGGNFECTCRPQALVCSLHLALPAVLVFVWLLWTDGTFQSVGRLLCSAALGGADGLHVGSLLGPFVHHVVRAAFVGLLWAVLVLMDGDWFVCCQSERAEQQLACKTITTEEDRVLIAELRNTSRVIGSFLLFGIVCVPAVTSTCGWRKSWRKKLYEKLILEQEEKVLRQILRKSAKEKLSEEVKRKLGGERWERCFDVAEELIQASVTPTVPEEEEQEEGGR